MHKKVPDFRGFQVCGGLEFEEVLGFRLSGGEFLLRGLHDSVVISILQGFADFWEVYVFVEGRLQLHLECI